MPRKTSVLFSDIGNHFLHIGLQCCLFFLETQAVKSVNAAIDSQDSDQLLKALQSSQGQFPQVHNFAAPLYLEELVSLKQEKQVSDSLP